MTITPLSLLSILRSTTRIDRIGKEVAGPGDIYIDCRVEFCCLTTPERLASIAATEDSVVVSAFGSQEDTPRLTNHRVVVTGAASGIGRASAVAFAQREARVALLDIARDQLVETARSLPGSGHVAIPCDVADVRSVSTAFDHLVQEFGAITTLVNNAGINPPVESSTVIDEDFYDQVMDVNVKGIFFCAQKAATSMMAGGSGVIVNLASVSGMIGWGGSSVYSASKGAVIALTKFLAVEFAPHGIRVNAVCPGSIRTPMVESNLLQLPDPEHAWRETASIHPLGRVGTAEEIADAIVFLASPQSSFITGTCLVVDGGLTAK